MLYKKAWGGVLCFLALTFAPLRTHAVHEVDSLHWLRRQRGQQSERGSGGSKKVMLSTNNNQLITRSDQWRKSNEISPNNKRSANGDLHWEELCGTREQYFALGTGRLLIDKKTKNPGRDTGETKLTFHNKNSYLFLFYFKSLILI
jgi:hypothetical protein